MFDVNALHAYRTFFAEEVVLERGGKRLIWKGRGSGDAQPGALAEASFEVEPLSGEASPIPPQIHRQRHFPEAEMLAALERAGLECVELFGHGFDAVLEQPLDDVKHSKAVYICRRAR
jgi:hypothetical protein